MCWQLLADEAPEHAQRVWASLGARRNAVLATLRADGSPRLSGIEAKVFDGQLWLGSMPGAWKAHDLHRDPRFALHNSTAEETVSGFGDARVSGRARPVHAESTRRRYAEWLAEHAGFDPRPGGFELFRADLAEAMLVRVETDQLVFDVWRPGRGVCRYRRR